MKRYDHRCFQLHFLVRKTILNVICCYALQSGLSAEEKDTFYERVFSVVTSVPEEKILVVTSRDMLENTLQGLRVSVEVVGMV